MGHANIKVISRSYSVMTVILFWCGLVVLSSMYITIPLISEFSILFNVSLQQAAWIGSSFSLFYALGCLLFGALSDQYGRKLFLMIGIVSITVVTFLIGFVEHFYLLLILRAIQGAVASVYAPISLVYVSELYPENKRLTVIGFITSGFLMAAIIGQVLSSAVVTYSSWENVFFILAGLYCISTFLVIFILPKDERYASTTSVFYHFKQMAILLTNKQLVKTLFITFITLLSLVSMYTVLGSYLSSETFGFSSQDILIIRALGIIGILLSPFAGRLSAKYGVVTILRMGLLFAVVGVGLLGVVSSIISIVLLSILFVAGIALVCPVTISIVSTLGEKVRGTAVTFNAFVLFVGASVGPVLAVFLIETISYRLSFLVLGIILIIGFFISIIIKVRYRK